MSDAVPTLRQQRWQRAERRPCTQCGQRTGYRANDPRGTSAVCRTCRDAGFSRARVVPPPTTTWSCVHCGKTCQRRPARGQRPKYCNKQCQQLASFYRRQAVLLGAYIEDVSPYEVFKADGYRCHLCNNMADRTKSVPHLRAPTVDHVIPLSKGGKHERANCRTACYSCNAAKQDRGGGEQFALPI